MEQNVGFADKLIRVIAGVVVVITGFYYGSWWGLLGLLPLVTASISFCPLYTLFGWSTGGKERKAIRHTR